MSTEHSAAHDSASHGSVSSYVTGFILAVILTVAAFGVAFSHALSPSGTLMAITVLAVIQVLVHLHYFLHMSVSPEKRWDNQVFIFTGLFVFILIVGTIFIMVNTSTNMMSR
ncbi:cytochrome o ubiquinol oxidase subunit IV [Acetobacter sp. AN02]|uniref:cytochrome o ubiquinol oxidase subunit IV n=1 Tax=Acetobacter sp. AN02 TaxID=2894186 RepID=UPI00243414B1|nr:cytochrome o ubiquinol oxidase subunit IV [Acetobacter sp. AN02]MDG6094673.1 cytochrome o ubiquinol oxidase subunit IV [Acetobacter sp. AN02]